MPESNEQGSAESLGIQTTGPVLSGEKSVEHVRADNDIRATSEQSNLVDRPFYKSTDDYDPVLRSHCRLPDRRT